MMIFFPLIMTLKAHTFVGQQFHNYLLSKSRENDDGDAQDRWFDFMNIPIEELGNDLKLYVVPFLSDNFSYVLLYKSDPSTSEDDNTITQALAVDPADPELVDKFLRHHNAQLTHILTTHRHADHAGGNYELKKRYPNVEIIGGQHENVSAATRTVCDGEVLNISFSNNCHITVDCITTPCHTSGHVVFVVQRSGGVKPILLFTGDHLFVGGCGRFFEGSAQNMFHSMQKLKQRIHTMFPDYGENNKQDIVVLCGHEYTVPNLQFACHIQPNNIAALRKFEWAVSRRRNKLPTVPSPWFDELQCNPFVRTDSDELKSLFGCNDPVKIMSMLGETK